MVGGRVGESALSWVSDRPDLAFLRVDVLAAGVDTISPLDFAILSVLVTLFDKDFDVDPSDLSAGKWFKTSSMA